jgi:NADH-quinone oxidoreductase subunit E
MSESVLEIILWVLLAFFVGCMLGYILRKIFAGRAAPNETSEPAPEERTESAKVAAVAVPSFATESSAPAFEDSPPPLEATTPETGTESHVRPPRPAPAKRAPASKPADKTARPKGIPTPRGGSPDPLQRISGVGPKIELTLHQLGIFHFDQIAKWTPEQQQWMDDQLKFKGRIAREEWVRQARLLAQGKDVDAGGAAGGGAEKKASRPRANSRSRKLGSS